MLLNVKLAPVIMILFLMTSIGYSRGSFFEASESEAVAALTAAQAKIAVCYEAFAKASSAGANMTTSQSVLNEAGELLSKAELSYFVNDFNSTVDFAIQSQDVLDDFLSKVEVLNENAVAAYYWDFLVKVAWSVFGVLLVGLGSFIAWRFLKMQDWGNDTT
ncbi:MAG: hypothetical protein JSV51_05505 [Candidatus Bathyarchaeota archaeon]|nr:MAG: hypothetical protein JSV51_05505 [Candidatus Bathyarchaeota archaeon]